jgi:glycosyltransferase involved in cell wall biosynthesis
MLADAVGRLFSSPIQAAAMGRAGRRIASERFDIDRQAARLVDEYRLAITAGSSR